MGTQQKSTPQRDNRQRPGAFFYVVVSSVAFLFGVLILSLMLWNAQSLVSLGLTGNSYYVLPLALVVVAATLLFGVLQYRKSSEVSPGPSGSFYVRNVPTNDAAIIFVHGVTGNSRSTWTSDHTGHFWPDMLTQDPSFDTANVFVYGYDSPRLGQSLTIGELGADLRLILSSNGIFTHKRIAFIMHSMGGLVVRSFLTEYAREEYVNHVKLLYFLATPTEGAQVAAVFSLASRNPQFRQMASADRANKLGEEIRRWLAQNFDIASYAAYETEKTFATVVVPMANALALSNRRSYPISKANHVTISKPDDDKAPQYLAFREAFKEAMAIRACLLKGVVIEDQVGGPGMDNVPVSVDEAAANSTISKDGGKFAFAFLDRQPGQTVHLRVNKEGYVVVNDVQLEVAIPANPDAKLLSLIVCKAEIREEMARRFYRLKSFDAIEESYQKRLKELEHTRQATAAALTKLQQERDQAKAAAGKASEELAKNRPGQNTELYQKAKRLFVEGKVEEAITLLDEEKLRELDKEAMKAVENAIQPRLLKAQLLTVKLRFEDAEKAYLQAIEIAPGGFEANFAYALFTQNQNRFEQAKAAYGRCLEWARKNGKDAELALTLNNLGVLDRDQGRLEEALQIYRELAQKNPETYRPDVAMTFNNLGVLDSDQGRLEEARRDYAEALQTYRELAQKNPETYRTYVAAALNNLGILDSRQRRMEEARNEFAEALQIRRELAQKNPEIYRPGIAMTLNNLGVLDSGQGRMEEARNEYGEALQIRRELAQKNPEAYRPFVADTLNNLGILDRDQGRMEEARNEFAEALQIYETLAKQDYSPRFSADVTRLKKLLAELDK
jgi:tetratricopeptide (TPR) repeat protein/pimeloyl-ACP methyl ester carboxylesterase